MTAEHGTLSRYKSGCRGRHGCAPCRAANAAYIRQVRAHNKLIGLPDDDPRHGNPSTYQNWGCRCPRCLEGHNDRPTRRSA